MTTSSSVIKMAAIREEFPRDSAVEIRITDPGTDRVASTLVLTPENAGRLAEALADLSTWVRKEKDDPLGTPATEEK